MKTAQTILDKKGTTVTAINGDATVLEAATLMNERRIGALVVTDGSRAVGIFTERDVLCRIVTAERDPSKTKVSEVMTAPMACCQRTTSVEECRAVMTEKRIRHLPVVEGGTLYGLVSAGDVLASESDEKQSTIEYLQEYLYGRR